MEWLKSQPKDYQRLSDPHLYGLGLLQHASDQLFLGPYVVRAFPSVTPGYIKIRGEVSARAPLNNGGVLNAARYAQTSYSNTFSSERIRIYSRLAGRPINTIDDLVGAVSAGHICASQIEVNYIVRSGGRALTLNTRTGQALEQAGILRSQCYAINRTGDPLYERLLSGQLQRNNLTNNGIANPVLDMGR